MLGGVTGVEMKREVWVSATHVVVYVESMEFPEPGEYRIVPLIQFSTAGIDCRDTCVWTKEINVHISEKTGIGMEKQPSPKGSNGIPAEEEKGIPGFEAVSAIAGLLAVSYILRRRKRK